MKKFNYLAMATLAAFALASCGGDDDEDFGGGSTPTDPTESTQESTMTVAESKQFLEDSAKETLNLFNSNDQKDAITFCDKFNEEYGDLEFPWDEEDFLVTRMMRNLSKGLRSASYSTLTRAASEAYIYEFSKIAGTYEPSGYEWKKTGNSNDTFTMKFNLDGKSCQIVIKASGSNAGVTFVEEDYDYDYNYGEYREYDVDHTIIAPKNVSFSVKEGSVEHASGTIAANVDEAGHVASCDIKVTASNLYATTVINGTDSQVSANFNTTIGGKTLATGTATVTGNNLCNRNQWESINENNAERTLNNMINEGIANANIIDKVQVKAKVTNVGTIYSITDAWYDSDEYSSKNEAKKACEEACETLAKCIIANLYYNGSDKKEAYITYGTTFEDWSYDYWEYWEYEIQPMVTFADGSTYMFDEYFDEFDFDSVADKFDVVIDSYKRLWK